LPKVRIYRDLCKGVEDCGLCMQMCPKKLFQPSEALNPKGYRPPQLKDEDGCTGCENCVIYCPDLAIAVGGKKSRRGVPG